MFKSIVLPVALLGAFVSVQADEGQWQPHQLPQLASELTRIGIALPAQKLAGLTQHPMSAIVSLDGCSASFVSSAGLIVTNHHCAYSAIQRNATPEHNYIADGFLASKKADELPGGPNSRVYLTDRVDNVTARVLEGLNTGSAMSATERHATIERRIKALISECEQDPAYRCAVPAFHRGLEYYRIRQLMIRDVRLVYAPSDRIGNYGGDVDNYEWPRHTGDFAFLRAYVGNDGRPADPSPDNVPYRSKDFLVVSSEGLKNGDPVLLAGYPGRTSRYKLPAEIRHAQQLDYPLRAQTLQADLDVIAAATAGDPVAALRYASVVKSLNNVLKKTRGLQDGFARNDIAAIKDEQYAQLRLWLAGRTSIAPGLLRELDTVIASDIALSGQEFGWAQAGNSDLLKSARTLYRLALEKKSRMPSVNPATSSAMWPSSTRVCKGSNNRCCPLSIKPASPPACKAMANWPSLCTRPAWTRCCRMPPACRRCTGRPVWPMPASAWPGWSAMSRRSTHPMTLSCNWRSGCMAWRSSWKSAARKSTASWSASSRNTCKL